MISFDKIKRFRSQKSLDRYIQKYCDGDPVIFLENLSNHFNDLLRSDIIKAGRFLDKIRTAFDFLTPKHRARLLALEARHYQYSGDNQKAVQKYESAITLNKKYRDFAANARLKKGLVNAYMYLGRYREALRTGKSALAYFRRKKMRNDAGQILNNIGNIYHRMDKVRAALRNYDRAREIFKRSGGIPLAIVEFNRGNIYSVLNLLNKARELYQSAEDVYAKAGNQIAICQIKYSRAIIDYWENNLTRALTTFEAIIDRLQELGDPRTAVIVQMDLVELNIELNLFSNAVYLAEDIIRKAEAMGMKYEQAKAHYMIARAAISCEDFNKARLALKKSEKYFKTENNQLWLGLLHFEKAKLFCARRYYKRAEDLARHAGRFFARSGDVYRANNARLLNIEIKLESGSAPEALKLALKLLKVRLPKSQRQKLFEIIGGCYFAREDYGAAAGWFKKAIGLIEKNLEVMFSDEIRFFYAADKYAIYKKLVYCFLKLGRPRSSYLNSLRALQVINTRSPGLNKWQKKIPSSLVRERDALRAALKKIHQTPGEGQRRVLSDSTVYYIEQKLWSVERKIKNQFLPHQYSRFGEISRDFLKAGLLSEDELLLNFITLDDEVGVFLVSAFGQKYCPLPVSARTISTDLHKLSFVCERAVFGFEKNERTSLDINHILRRIYDYLLKPIKAPTAKKNLILLANGDFFQIPFGALINEDGQYLKDLHNISFVCDPIDILNRAKPLPPFLQSKNAVFAAGSDNLPSIAVEAQKINETFTKTNVYIDSQANSRNLLTELKNSNGFLHIAAHASRSSENPLFSKILLDDGPLFPFDIYGVNLRPTLITLSGCHTAAPGLYYGNSFSLAKAYYQAGSRFVLASLWPVSDKISSFFMIQFYRSLAKNNNVGFAYKKAVDITMNIIDNPAFWSSFIVLGI